GRGWLVEGERRGVPTHFASHVGGTASMLRNTKVQMLAVLTVGVLLGYAGATGRLWPTQKAEAGPPAPRTEAPPTPQQQPDCCSQGLSRDKLVAVAAHNDEVAVKAAQQGKKPNILFIMGDDVGWFNVGAYHRGIMSGKTPNLDKLASQGVVFTDYYAEASC